MEVALNMEKFRVMGSRLRPIKKNPLKVINLQGILISVAVRTGLTGSFIKTDIQHVIRIFQGKHPVLHLLHFYVFPIGICLVPTLQMLMIYIG